MLSKCAFAAIAAAMTFVLVSCGYREPLPPAPTDAAESERELQAFVESLKPRRSGKPVIVIVALNDSTETTDFLLTHAVLQRAGVAEVFAVAPRAGRVTLYPALEVDGVLGFTAFDKARPAGADYVIVPAMSIDDDPAITGWLQQQAARGARIIGVCAGAVVLGRAGLLDGRRFTTHWYYRKTVLERHPTATYVPHQRYLADRDVGTTTGISASVPAMLALVQAIGGRDRTAALAAELGVDAWTPAHDSSLFGLDAKRMWNYAVNKVAFWRHKTWRVDVRDGMDDIALAFAADAWSRTGRVSVEASASGPVKLRSGLVLVAEPAAPGTPRVPLAPALKPAQQLDRTLCEIADRFGAERRDWVMMELEYADADACAPIIDVALK